MENAFLSFWFLNQQNDWTQDKSSSHKTLSYEKNPPAWNLNLICTKQFVSQIRNPLKVGKLQVNFKFLHIFLSVLYHFNQNQHRFPNHSFSLQKSTAVTFSDTVSQCSNEHRPALNLQPEPSKHPLWGALSTHCTQPLRHSCFTVTCSNAPSNTDNITFLSGAVPRWGKTYRKISLQDLLVMANNKQVTHMYSLSPNCTNPDSKCWNLNSVLKHCLILLSLKVNQAVLAFTAAWRVYGNSSHTPTPSLRPSWSLLTPHPSVTTHSSKLLSN